MAWSTLAGAVRDLPDGLAVRSPRESDVPALTELVRAVDIAGGGDSQSTAAEVRADLADPDVGWHRGAALVTRAEVVVAALHCFNGLATGRGWYLDLFLRPGDGQADAVAGTLVDSALRLGRVRWAELEDRQRAAVADPPAKAAVYANDEAALAALAAHGFVEDRRFWEMRIDHAPAGPATSPAPSTNPGAGPHPLPGGYRIRAFRDDPADWAAIHATASVSFQDHYDYHPLPFEAWRTRVLGQTGDPSQWFLVELVGADPAEDPDRPAAVVAYAMGNNRFADEGVGYVASIGVLRDHRGRGLASALLRRLFEEDRARGRRATCLHVDSMNPTGATQLYQSVGMRQTRVFIQLRRNLLG